MARVTVEDCIRYYPNRFEMVLLASRRARQLLRGMPAFLEEEEHKPVVQSLRELGDGHVTWECVFEAEEQERRRLMAASSGESANDV
ncbi:MAG: DNA-directed RNA polymerase subunit omega [Zetaproteobacteria bacterium CG12_big_fil_rev_8_21_14_0_65_55_1124]|nr:MAG: DNA-directed RNA polymerase subunit omega [Zetaproteobacteria bacterium CG1_02_55_237]PIS20246.1 MAG: DNA-directed RNA polymerase subunit omega [Zetaproteobacteria bacterium CG08_land_8_20_14_0_20_55_17]PIW43123.1 MAG: DNA-directed RNA polymerase subunit omega [Zetaproteobacteria bacterium CG12_big_fil_rev_8_21_14_0_65_55_1124]PIY52087.1 MAG: DNA-directed RNA polymerase subunit omega [Zetaproteobacteria bacterium CG_4_10_14_0_8_um_filter_55_43]PIZ38099.1 MAG: DNA-directed RNA polymerase